MARKKTAAQEAEMRQLHAACIAILVFYDARGSAEPVVSQFRAVVEQTLQDSDLRGLRILRRDLQEWVGDLPADARTQLTEQLRLIEAEGGDPYLTAALRKGRIDSEDEYRGVLARVEEIHANSGSQAEVTRLNALLTQYHQDTH